MRRMLDIFSSMAAAGFIAAALVGGVVSGVLAAILLAPDPFGIAMGLAFGLLIGFFFGGMLGAIVGCAAGIITLLFDAPDKSKRSYKVILVAVCTPLSTVLSFTASERFLEPGNRTERDIVSMVTIACTVAAFIISLYFANYYRRFTRWNNDRYLLLNEFPVTK